MLTQTEKDRKENKKLKTLVITINADINYLINLGTLPLDQTPQYFYPNSLDSQQLVKKIQRGTLLLDTIQEWV